MYIVNLYILTKSFLPFYTIQSITVKFNRKIYTSTLQFIFFEKHTRTRQTGVKLMKIKLTLPIQMLTFKLRQELN